MSDYAADHKDLTDAKGWTEWITVECPDCGWTETVTGFEMFSAWVVADAAIDHHIVLHGHLAGMVRGE